MTVAERFGGFQSPTRLAITSAGDIYISDHRRGQVITLDRAGKRIGTIGGLGAPLGLAVFEPPPVDAGSGGKKKKRDSEPEPQPMVLYVGDEADGSVRMFVDGVEVGTLGQGAGEFLKPNGIAAALDAQGTLKVYVVDSKANQVKVYDGEGLLVHGFGGPGTADGQFKFPSDIAIDRSLGIVYVSDFGNERVAVFGLDGAYQRAISAPPNDRGDPVFLRPAGLGIDGGGRLYVVDNGLSCVAILDPDGALVEVIGYRDGQYWTQELQIPVDAAAFEGRVWVTSNRQRELVAFEAQP